MIISSTFSLFSLVFLYDKDRSGLEVRKRFEYIPRTQTHTQCSKPYSICKHFEYGYGVEAQIMGLRTEYDFRSFYNLQADLKKEYILKQRV